MAARFLPHELILLKYKSRSRSFNLTKRIFAPTSSRLAVQLRAMSAQLQSRRGELAIGTELHGDSGCVYRLTEVLSLRERPFVCVYLAR